MHDGVDLIAIFMANEITASGSLRIIQSGLTGQITKQFNVTMVGTSQDFHDENYSSTATKIVISAAVKAEGAGLFMLNNPSDNTANVSLLVSLDNNATYPLKVLPGESLGPVRLSVAAGTDPNIFVKTDGNVQNGCAVGFTGR